MVGASALRTVPRFFSDTGGVIALAMTRLQGARIRDAVRSNTPVHFVDVSADIVLRLRDSLDSVDAVILPASVDDTSVERVIREITTRWRRVATIVYCDTMARESTDLRALTLAGAHQFVFLGVNDDRRTFQSILAAARQAESDSGIDISKEPERVGASVATGSSAVVLLVL